MPGRHRHPGKPRIGAGDVLAYTLLTVATAAVIGLALFLGYLVLT